MTGGREGGEGRGGRGRGRGRGREGGRERKEGIEAYSHDYLATGYNIMIEKSSEVHLFTRHSFPQKHGPGDSS